MHIKLFVFFLAFLISNLCQASYSAEYNALLPEYRRPRKSPEWWKDGMGYKSPYWPQHGESASCGKKNEELYGEYHFYSDSPEFISQSTEVFNKIKDALRKNDKRAFANLISYPMRWNIIGEDIYYIYLHTPDQVIYHYNAMMNKKTKQHILESEAPYVAMKDSFKQIVIGRSSLWLQCEMKIYIVNNKDPNLKALLDFEAKHPKCYDNLER